MSRDVTGQLPASVKIPVSYTHLLHSAERDIHYNLYTPESYDGTEPYALFVTLAGYEGLYFQGVGANLAEDFGFEAQSYNERMLVLAPQLNDWGETSARQTIALVEYFMSAYNIDPARVYLCLLYTRCV